MIGEYRDKAQGIVYTAVMVNDGEYTIYKERPGWMELLGTWTIPEGVAFAIADLFEREEERRLVAAATDKPTEQVNRPDDEYFAHIKSDSYTAYLNNNNNN